MNTFPLLRTGAVTQYPLLLGTSQGVSIIRFLDGAEQRFLSQGRQFRRWQINLRQLSDAEISRLETFFEQQSGAYSPFTFPDPYSRTDVPNCRLDPEEFAVDVTAFMSSTTSFWVVETNG